jgi:indolepyruvate ferredoxin oxidoreductase beta subunit
VAFDAVALARQAGNMKTLNVVMLGAISSYLPIPEETLVECIRNMVPPKTIDTNLKAFRLGRETTRQ